MILAELKQVMPSFVSRVDRPDRGGEWISYLEERRDGDRAAGSPGSASTAASRRRPRRRSSCVHVDGTEEDLLAACLFEAAGVLRDRDPRRGSSRSTATSGPS